MLYKHQKSCTFVGTFVCIRETTNEIWLGSIQA
jgi:hypothetical protein